MDSNLEGAICAASEAFLNVAEESRELKDEMLQLRVQTEWNEDFHQSLKQLFDTYYGGQG